MVSFKGLLARLGIGRSKRLAEAQATIGFGEGLKRKQKTLKILKDTRDIISDFYSRLEKYVTNFRNMEREARYVLIENTDTSRLAWAKNTLDIGMPYTEREELRRELLPFIEIAEKDLGSGEIYNHLQILKNLTNKLGSIGTYKEEGDLLKLIISNCLKIRKEVEEAIEIESRERTVITRAKEA